MTQLTKQDLQFIVSRLPRDVVSIMKERAIILGGGFIRATIAGEKPSDIDLFGATKDQLAAAALVLEKNRFGSRLHRSKNAFTLLSGSRMPVQFIHRWLFQTPADCMESFDFTIAQAVIWFTDGVWESCCHDRFYMDLAARRLTYSAPARNEDAGGSLLRVRKFLSRGYNIQAPALAGVLARLCMGVAEFKNAMDEKRTAAILCGLLREVDPLVAIDGVDLVDEHEIEGGEQ